MNHPYGNLTREYHHIARRRHVSWITHPHLAAVIEPGPATPHERYDLIVKAVRSYDDDQDRSDETIRTLAYIGTSKPDAITVLLHALAPTLDFRLWRSATTDYRIDALGDLAIVIRDATDAGDIDKLPGLAQRLTRRAHQRSNRRVRPRQREDRWEPQWFAHPDAAGASLFADPTDDVAEMAAVRTDLQAFVRSLKADLKEPAWTAYRQHRLVRAISPDSEASSDTVRATASRAARQARPLAARYLEVHA